MLALLSIVFGIVIKGRLKNTQSIDLKLFKKELLESF
jgi:hypothetical protein